MSSIIMSTEFNPENISVSEPRKNQMGGSNSMVYYKNSGKNIPLRFQTPRMRIPFGINKQDGINGTSTKYSVNLSLNLDDSNISQFFESIKILESRVLDTIVSNSQQWVGRQITKESAIEQELFKSTIKYPKDKKYSPTIKIKIPYSDLYGSKFALETSSKPRLDIPTRNDDGNFNEYCIPKGSEMIAIIECVGVYFIGKSSFGITFKLCKGRIFEMDMLSALSIVDDTDDDNDGSSEESYTPLIE